VDLDIPKDSVEILIHEVPQSHWGIGGIPASEKFKDVKVPGWDPK
jgi:4-oxalocrotonate tautomerase